MADSALLMTVRLPERRYHGVPEWPPSPFRLYQALVAGGLMGEPEARVEEIEPVMAWLENLSPPVIAVPPSRQGRGVHLYMPNNDLDTVGGDPRFAAKIRGAEKRIIPRMLEADIPLTYLWTIHETDTENAQRVATLSSRLYQLGRGVDMAYASAEILPVDDAKEWLASQGAILYTAQEAEASGAALRCPVPGSFRSLRERYHAQQNRLTRGHLTQAPPARFHTVTYNAKPHRLLYDLVATTGSGSGFHPVPTKRTAWLVEQIRDRLATLLTDAFGERLVERVVIGRGANEADKVKRIAITPLPSIGSPHADQAIRRILITIPPDCPIPAREIEWAAGAVHLGVNGEGEIVDAQMPQLVRATDEGMLDHYGVGRRANPCRLWRTVTPVVLPMRHLNGHAKGSERADHEARAAGAVLAALRHAGVDGTVKQIRVQREPFQRKGTRAADFATPPRLTARHRYHAEITFSDQHPGPLLIGDGRYLGLGLFAPVRGTRQETFVFTLPSNAQLPLSERATLLKAVRRALMALSRDITRKGRTIPKLFSGHERDGAPASASGRHDHVFLAADDTDGDGRLDRLFVLAPWSCDRSVAGRDTEKRHFERVVLSLRWLNLEGRQCVQLSEPEAIDPDDPIIRPSYTWESSTPYRPTRHPKRRSSDGDIQQDVICECGRRGLPRPTVQVLGCEAGPRGGNPLATIKLEFSVAVHGPLLLGRGSHAGDGLFKGSQSRQ